MRNIKAIFLKQLSDTLKNKMVLLQFLMFPVVVIVMENSVDLEGMPEHFFVKLFAVMFVGMAPLTSMSSMIAEEKEKNTLRVLMMSNVKPAEYLAGVGAYVFLMCMAGTAVFAVVGGYEGKELAVFIGAMTAGILLSMITGAVIGIGSKDQMTATSITYPVMIVFSFVPMLSMFNDTIKKAAQIVYSQQISEIINCIGTADIKPVSIVVLSAELAAVMMMFAYVYRRRGLE